jgi:hypothetical protein
MGFAKRRIAPVAVLVVVLAVGVSLAYGSSRPDPKAHVACAANVAGPCSESGSIALPPNSSGTESTDVVPTKATEASMFIEPASASELSSFDASWATVVENNPKLGNIKNTIVRRVITCSVMAREAASLLQSVYDDASEGMVRADNAYAMWLAVCLQVTISSQQQAPPVASAASVGCAQANFSATVMVSRAGSSYVARLVGRTHRATGRVPLVVSCRAKGRGMLVSLRPRLRSHRVGPLLGPHLSVGFSNPTSQSVGIHTRFTFR